MGPFAGLFTLLCVATFFEGFDTKLASLVQPVIGSEFGASTEELGAALGISTIGMSLGFFAILLADSIGRRPVFLAALFAYAVLTLATALAPNLILFTTLQFFARMAMVVELFVAYLILSEEMPSEIRGRVNGLFASIAALGAAVPDGLLAPLDSIGLGWRGLFLIGSLPLLLFPLYLKRIRETSAFLGRAKSASGYGEEFKASARALWSSVHRGRLVRVTGIWLAINFWTGTALYFFTIYTFGDRGWDATDLQRLPWGTIPFGLAGYILSGIAMDRFGRRLTATSYLVAAFAATLLCYRSTDDTSIYLGIFLLYGLGGVWTVITTWTTELFPTEMRATALGLANLLIGRLGLAAGPIVAGQLSAAWQSTPDAVTVLAGVTLLALPLVWSLPETNAIDLRGVTTISGRDSKAP
ncbi:MAG: MFS transporter [bacterium]|nr:MFS transporter [bacterium]